MAMVPSYSIEITSIEERRQDSSSTDCFCVNFRCTRKLIRIEPTNPTSELSSTSITVKETFLVPWNILCDCTELSVQNRENTRALQEAFSSMPISPELLDSILPHIGEFARKTILSSNRYDGCKVWEIDVNLHVTTYLGDYCDIDLCQHAPVAAQLVNLLERVKIEHDSRYSAEQCSICLEGLGHGSSSELVRTNCLHVFHADCIFRWLLRCINRQSSYSCPLCRCLMISSEEDE